MKAREGDGPHGHSVSLARPPRPAPACTDMPGAHQRAHLPDTATAVEQGRRGYRGKWHDAGATGKPLAGFLWRPRVVLLYHVGSFLLWWRQQRQVG